MTGDTIYVGVKNWDRFQQYKDGRPIRWIKLHLALQSDYEFSRLPELTQLYLIRIWLLAAERGNRLPLDAMWITQQIGAETVVDLERLVRDGWLVPLDGASVESALKYLSARNVRNGTSPYTTRARKRRVEERREDTDESLPTVETSSEAGPRVENLGETVAPAVREYLWLGPDAPGSDWNMGREISIAKELGLPPDESAGLCIGIRLLADKGKLGHVEPGEPCTLRVAYHQKSGATPVVNLALHYWRKHAANGTPPEKRKRRGLEPVEAQLAREGERVS